MKPLAEIDLEKVRMFIKNNDTEAVVGSVLFMLGFKSKLLGTKYLHAALVETQKCEGCYVCRELYAKIAAKFQTKASCVERSIRHCISDCQLAGTLLRINDLFGITVVDRKYPPTNRELICELSSWIRLESVATELANAA